MREGVKGRMRERRKIGACDCSRGGKSGERGSQRRCTVNRKIHTQKNPKLPTHPLFSAST